MIEIIIFSEKKIVRFATAHYCSGGAAGGAAWRGDDSSFSPFVKTYDSTRTELANCLFFVLREEINKRGTKISCLLADLYLCPTS